MHSLQLFQGHLENSHFLFVIIQITMTTMHMQLELLGIKLNAHNKKEEG